MRLSVLLFCGAAFALTGCSTAGSLFAANSAQPAPVDLANAYVPAASPVPADFCQRVGQSARKEAMAAGFDAPTQDRIALQNLQQCSSFAPTQYASL